MVKLFFYFISFFCIPTFLAAIEPDYRISPVVTGLNYPWAMAILPDNTFLITQKPGSIRIVKNDILLDQQLSGVPDVVYSGQGGLLDICLHPNFKENKFIYLSYSKELDGFNKLVVTRYKLDGYALTLPQDIFVSKTKRKTALHHGARLVFIGPNHLLISSGDGYSYMKQAQNLDTHFGKLISLTADGGIPSANPFILHENALADIYTFGHRNPQGFAFDAKREIIYSHEHGPKGGDELNIIEPGKNYGWPEVTFGVDYSGRQISKYTHKNSIEPPIYHWTPSIALSSMIIYTHDYFRHWKDDLFITGLKSRDVRRLTIKNNRVVKESVLFSELGVRLRYIAQSSTGELYLLQDSPNATLFKVERK